MNFRLISKNGDALAIALKMQDEGHKVDCYIKVAKAKSGYQGILPQKDNWESAPKDTIMLVDMVGLGSIANKLKSQNYAVYGGGSLHDRLELDRDFGMKLAKMSGLSVPEYKRFSSFAKAAAFLQDQKGGWVFKPLNNQAPAYTYVAGDTDDMIEMLAYFKDVWKGKVDFILQKKIDGVEVSTEAWYVDGEPVPGSLNSTIELKRFMVGEKGPNTGCQGSTVRFWKKADPKIYRLTLKKVESFLRRFQYNGPLDCNVIIAKSNQKPYFLEWTARIGYDAVYAMAEGLNQPWGGFLADLAHGDVPKLKPSYDWLGAVRVSIPPYPNEAGAEKSAGRPVGGIDDLEHVWPLDVKYEKDKLVTAGVDGVVAEVTGKSAELADLDHIYKRVGKLRIPDAQYRTDIFSEAEKRIKKLQQWKYF